MHKALYDLTIALYTLDDKYAGDDCKLQPAL